MLRPNARKTLPFASTSPFRQTRSLVFIVLFVVLILGAIVIPFSVLEWKATTVHQTVTHKLPYIAPWRPSKVSLFKNQINEETEQRLEELKGEQEETQGVIDRVQEKQAEADDGDSLWDERANAVKDAFLHAWRPYEEKCFGQDEYHPISGTCGTWMGAGLTIVDSLSTMHVMGLTEEFNRGTNWVKSQLKFTHNQFTSFFETTIRILGGLLSAYDLSEDGVYLTKAQDIGDRLKNVFNTPTGIPLGQINLVTGATAPMSWTGGASLLAEVGTCQVEFFTLAKRTNNAEYSTLAQKPIDFMEKSNPSIAGLYPIYIDPNSGRFNNGKIAWGAMGDSFYEYLLKMYLLTGKQHEQYANMYRQSIDAMFKNLYRKTPNGYYYIADMDNNVLEHKMDHLVCFAPGMLALGVKHGVVTGSQAEDHMTAAHELMRTCVYTYQSQPSGIGPEYSRFTPEAVPGHDASYKLRPETVESLFVLWRVTGNVQYRNWGWDIFQAIQLHCKVQGGYAALLDVRTPERKEDKMESFFLAETLKYLYLLFTRRDVIPIFPTEDSEEYYVFNTEAHPVKAWSSWP